MNNYNKKLFVPVITYNNRETDKFLILKNIKSKAGIYMWTNLESSMIYIGFAVDLSKRLKKKLLFSYRVKTSK
jgi:excinuclease UvrABC nuclease subunit